MQQLERRLVTQYQNMALREEVDLKEEPHLASFIDGVSLWEKNQFDFEPVELTLRKLIDENF